LRGQEIAMPRLLGGRNDRPFCLNRVTILAMFYVFVVSCDTIE